MIERPWRKIPPRLKTSPPKVDLESFQKAVNEAAARVRGLWLGYVALLAYLFIAVGAVTHRDLLLQAPVKLPVLNVNLPLTGFFAVAPVFFLINHFYLLLQLLGLGRRVREFNDAITKANLGGEDRRRERRKLDTFVIVQLLGGTKEEREKLTGRFLNAISLITLVIAPILLLLFIQLQFLPYQSEGITWLHRIALGVDLTLLWIFWPSIRLGTWAPSRGTPIRAMTVTAIVFFACALATFSGEFADGGVKRKEWTKLDHSSLSVEKFTLFGNSRAVNKREGLLPFSRTLSLADKKLIDLDKFDKIKKRHGDSKDSLKPWESGRTLDLRDRNLRGALFDRSDLRNVDLNSARLQGASLRSASLQGASLNSTFLWRSYGVPDVGEPVASRINDPQLQALTTEQFKELEKKSLDGVASEDVKERIRTRLALFSKPELEQQNKLPADFWYDDFWTDLDGKVSDAKYQERLADQLLSLACAAEDAPYVAQGLVRVIPLSGSRFEDVGVTHLPRVARILLDAAEGKPTDCPGAVGMDAASIAQLRKWTK